MEWTDLTYPVDLRPDDNDTILVTMPGLPGATFGSDRADALVKAQAFLIDALEFFMTAREPIPAPVKRGRLRVGLPPSVALKVRLYQALLDANISKARLAEQMGQPKQQIDRLFKLRYRSRVDQLDAAFAALGLAVDQLQFRKTA
ncbi:MAG TPA: helix-turn-helix transcriptional regulator [Luteitalea sp.]|nr:helix-turn-helix transcriptional regulator [Luteitalea sp.]